MGSNPANENGPPDAEVGRARRTRWSLLTVAIGFAIAGCSGDETTVDGAPVTATAVESPVADEQDVPTGPECTADALLEAYGRSTLDVADRDVTVIDFACTPADAEVVRAYATVETEGGPVLGEPRFGVVFGVVADVWEADNYGTGLIAEGRDEVCAAGGTGTACDEQEQSSSDATDTADVTSLPAGLLCRDLAADGYDYGDALVYWDREGTPDRMDADLDGIPCETVYPEADAEGRRVEAETLARAEVFLPRALAACNAYSLATSGVEPFDGSADDPTVGGGFGALVGDGLLRWVDADGVELVLDVDAEIVTGPDGPDGVMPRPYSFACPPELFVGTLDEGGAPEELAVLEPDPGGFPVRTEGAIVRGDPSPAYLVVVPIEGAGSMFYVTVTSPEDNAVVRVVAPDGTPLVEEVMTAQFDITDSGEYLVEVGATRGNATYTLEVGISVPAG